jgi:tetratricopeptide (TPR) repeat protein
MKNYIIFIVVLFFLHLSGCASVHVKDCPVGINVPDIPITDYYHHDEKDNNPVIVEHDRKEILGFTKQIEADQADWSLLHNRGVKKLMSGDKKGALEDFGRELELNPDSFWGGYYMRALVERDLGALTEALADLYKAAWLNPFGALIYNARAVTKGGMGDLAGAVSDCTKAIEINNRNIRAYCLRGEYRFRSCDPSGAVDDYKKAMEIDPDAAPVYNFLAEAAYYEGDYTSCYDYADKCIFMDQGVTASYYYRGLALIGMGNVKRGRDDLQKAADMGSKCAADQIKKIREKAGR